MNKRNSIIVIAVLGVLVLGGAGFALTRDKNKSETPKVAANTVPKAEPGVPDPATVSPNGVVNTVDIANFAFSPASLTVKKGTKVTWTNSDTAPHTITVDTGYGPMSKQLAKGSTYSFIYDLAGTYAYHCELHATMKATVIVTE